MKYNFDEIINRQGTNSVKWDNLEEVYGRKDILPMWVADMDFKVADEILKELSSKLEHGVFGYNLESDSLYNSIIDWVKNKYDWHIKKEWILFTPGVVPGLNIGIREFVNKGEKVVIQPPVYPPFYRVLENNGVEAVLNPLIHDGDKFVMDYESLESSLDKDTKVMMICNPHNPVGRVWTRAELTRLGDIALKHNMIILSDEIHGDLTFKGHKTMPIASISKELAQNTITFMAPSKTFNIAGLATSLVIIPNEEIRMAYSKEIENLEIGKTTVLGAAALEAAYTGGEDWLEEVIEYIESNADFAIDYINRNIPKIIVEKPEGTYLLWLNFKSLNISQDEVNDALVNIGRIGLNDGIPYGIEGEGYFRLNIACPRATLEDGLERIKKAVDSLKS